MAHEMENEEPTKVEVTEKAQAAPLTPVAPITREELAAKLEQLSARAKAAGLSPVKALLDTYVRRGMAMIDSLLEGLEEEASKKSTPEDAPTKKKGSWAG